MVRGDEEKVNHEKNTWEIGGGYITLYLCSKRLRKTRHTKHGGFKKKHLRKCVGLSGLEWVLAEKTTKGGDKAFQTYVHRKEI